MLLETHHPLPWLNVMLTLLKSIMRKKRTKAWSPRSIWRKMLQTHFKSKIAEVQPNKGITSWPNEPAVESSNGSPWNTAWEVPQCYQPLAQKDTSALWPMWCRWFTLVATFPLGVRDKSLCAKEHRKALARPRTVTMKLPQKNNEVLRSLHYSSTCNLVGALQLPLNNTMSKMQRSARDFLGGFSAAIFHMCPNHKLEDSKALHTRRTHQVLHCIRPILLLSLLSKPSRMKEVLKWISTCQ